MWKAFWQKWTIDKPAMLGDWLWNVLVVQFAAFLDGLTWRQIVTWIPVIILLLAYSHDIPVSPALVFVGDLLAYVDIFAVLLLLGVLSRVATILFVIRQEIARVRRLAGGLVSEARRRIDLRHRRERGSKGQRRLTGRSRNDDDEPVFVADVFAPCGRALATPVNARLRALCLLPSGLTQRQRRPQRLQDLFEQRGRKKMDRLVEAQVRQMPPRVVTVLLLHEFAAENGR